MGFIHPSTASLRLTARAYSVLFLYLFGWSGTKSTIIEDNFWLIVAAVKDDDEWINQWHE
jgi:hypothetical protein